MNVNLIMAGVRTIHGMLNALAILRLTSYRFPAGIQVNDGATFDYIVVGAGTAGSVVANRLTEDPRIKVLLVEAGGDPPLQSVIPSLMFFVPGSPADWKTEGPVQGYSDQCKRDKKLKFTRGMMLGGSSGMSGMVYARGDPASFDEWARIAKDDTWSYRNVLPYFIKSEALKNDEILNSRTGHLHGTDGYLGVIKPTGKENVPFLNAFREIGHNVVLDPNGPERNYFSETMYMISNNVRQSTAQAFLGPIGDRPNLYVLKRTLATHIVFDKDKNARGVWLLTKSGKWIRVFADREVIISAGPIGTAKLLMLSGIGPRAHLQDLSIPVIADLPVGINMFDESHILLAHIFDKKYINPSPLPDSQGVPLVFINGFVSADNTSYPNYQTYNLVINAEMTTLFCTIYLGMDEIICQDLYEQSRGKTVFLTILADLEHPPKARVLLRNRDPRADPLVQMSIFPDRESVEGHVRYIRDFLKVERSSFFRRIQARRFVPKHLQFFALDSDEYWGEYLRCLSYIGYLYRGTAAMGSVVDSRLRVSGVKRLRVVDSSVMPVPVRSKPIGPIIAVAEIASDMIKYDNAFN